MKREKKEIQVASLQVKLDCDHQTQRFRMEPENISPEVKVKPYRVAMTKVKFTCRMTQLPVNLNDTSTGYKLQGTTKNIIIISSWPKGNLFKNWKYVVLSRVQTLEGLYLLEPISLTKSFKARQELAWYLRLVRRNEKSLLTIMKTRKRKLTKKRKLPAKQIQNAKHSQV